MKTQKAFWTTLALLAGLGWAVLVQAVPLPGAIEDALIAVVGVAGLALGAVFRTFVAVAGPMSGVLRVFAVPLALGLIGWLTLRELRKDRA